MTMFFEPDDYEDEFWFDDQEVCCPQCDSDNVKPVDGELAARTEARERVGHLWYRCLDCGRWWMES